MSKTHGKALNPAVLFMRHATCAYVRFDSEHPLSHMVDEKLFGIFMNASLSAMFFLVFNARNSHFGPTCDKKLDENIFKTNLHVDFKLFDKPFQGNDVQPRRKDFQLKFNECHL